MKTKIIKVVLRFVKGHIILSFSCSLVVPLSLLRSTQYVSWTTLAREPEGQAQLSIHTAGGMKVAGRSNIETQ